MTMIEQEPATPLDRAAEWTPSELRRVVVRLSDGEVVQLGTAPNRDSALVLARTVIAEIEDPRGEWPLVGDRLLKPEAKSFDAGRVIDDQTSSRVASGVPVCNRRTHQDSRSPGGVLDNQAPRPQRFLRRGRLRERRQQGGAHQQ